VKSQPKRAGESDLFATRNESAHQSSAAGHADSICSSPKKKVATSVATVDSECDGHSISGVADAILEVGRQRNTLLTHLRIALESGNEREALNLARRLCGL
jgi:hypothetical protein